MCYSDDLTKIHEHKETGAIYFEYGGRFFDSNRKPLDPADVPKKFQLQLIGTESEVEAGLARQAEAGATDFTAFVFTPRGENAERTRRLLVDYSGHAQP